MTNIENYVAAVNAAELTPLARAYQKAEFRKMVAAEPDRFARLSTDGMQGVEKYAEIDQMELIKSGVNAFAENIRTGNGIYVFFDFDAHTVPHDDAQERMRMACNLSFDFTGRSGHSTKRLVDLAEEERLQLYGMQQEYIRLAAEAMPVTVDTYNTIAAKIEEMAIAGEKDPMEAVDDDAITQQAYDAVMGEHTQTELLQAYEEAVAKYDRMQELYDQILRMSAELVQKHLGSVIDMRVIEASEPEALFEEELPLVGELTAAKKRGDLEAITALEAK